MRTNYLGMPYQHLNLAKSASLPQDTHVVHVTKEFGPASMGGLGNAVTALAVAQQLSGLLHVSVISPFYSYLRTAYGDQIHPFANVHVSVRTGYHGPAHSVTCKVFRLRWHHVSPGFQSADESGIKNSSETASITIPIYLIGPGDRYPFQDAFHATGIHDVYSAYKPLPQEWKDIWFAKAAAELLGCMSAGAACQIIEESNAGRPNSAIPVQIAHLHGATNAITLFFMHHSDQRQLPSGTRSPATVYTLHDYIDEAEYSNAFQNVARFMNETIFDAKSSTGLDPYLRGGRFFASALGIDMADYVTFVSRAIAEDLVEGRFRFHLQELILPSLLRRAARAEFFGVSNGVDFSEDSRNPFISSALISRSLSFDLRGLQSCGLADDFPMGSFVDTKYRAKQYLVTHLPHVFLPGDVERPLFLFIGRFQFNKGCELFEPLVRFLASREGGGRLVAIGTRNNYPHIHLKRLEKDLPAHFTLLDDPETSQQGLCAWVAPVMRMAADFVYVPSFKESFGLVAVEGLVFGAYVLSTGAGGQREFLRDNADDPSSNAFLFSAPRLAIESGEPGTTYTIGLRAAATSVDIEVAKKNLVYAASRALWAWEQNQLRDTSVREQMVCVLVTSTLKLSWDRKDGPLEHVR